MLWPSSKTRSFYPRNELFPGNKDPTNPFPTFVLVFLWDAEGRSGDVEAEEMLPPDHQPTCFIIHRITSSLGGAGTGAARSRISLEEDRRQILLQGYQIVQICRKP